MRSSEVALVDPVGLAELVDVAVQQQHLRLHAEGDRRSVHPRDAGADDDDLGRVHARHAAHQHSAATALAHQVVGAALRREPAGDLAIGASSGSARRRLHRLVGDRRDALLDQRVRALAGRRQVQVGEEGLALPHPVELLADRLLDLEDEVAARPSIVGGRKITAPADDEGVVGDAGAGSSAWSSTKTSWSSEASSCTPAGVIATRYSWTLTSLGTPTSSLYARLPGNGDLSITASNARRGGRPPPAVTPTAHSVSTPAMSKPSHSTSGDRGDQVAQRTQCLVMSASSLGLEALGRVDGADPRWRGR